MEETKLKGLKGLKGLSRNEFAAWKNAQIAAGKINNSTPYMQMEILYNNQQYINKYGIDAFKSKSYDDRMAQWKHDIIQPVFDERYSSLFNDDENTTGPEGELYDPSKGMGRDFFKYNIMSDESKLKLIEQGYLSKSEMDARIHREQDELAQIHMDPRFAGTEAGSAAIFAYHGPFGKDFNETIERGQNDKILERIWAGDLRDKTRQLGPVVDQYYRDEISKLSDDEIDSGFMEAIKPKEGEGAAHIFAAYFNDDGTPRREMENFSREDKRQFLAKKAVYDHYLGPEASYDALNNQGKEYLNNHQAWYTYVGLLAKDIGISTASYTADKWNSIRRLSLWGQSADVYMTNNGDVVPTADVKFDGDQAFYEKDGQSIPVYSQTLSLIALDDMGKDSNGEDRGSFNNAQFWTNAEQFGTLDKEEQAKYKELGSSPYKVVYKPGDETDLWYESIKMTSFGLADIAINLIPAGSMAAGTNIMTKAAQMTGAMSKAMSTVGKTLYYTGKVGTRVNPTISAIGIGNAYGRGVFGETFTGNLQQLEQSVTDQAQREVFDFYNTNPEYKAQFDAKVEQEYLSLMSQYSQQLAQQNGSFNGDRGIYLDNSNDLEFQEILRNQAMRNVTQRETSEWAKNFRNSEGYSKALQEAAESASSAALTASLTTAVKYVAVNYGWRKFIFKTPSELASTYRKGAVSDVEEVVNSAGKKRLTSKFDFLTSGDQRRKLTKIVGSQFWGGAWTNATDELQSGGGRRMNEDRMGQYIQGMYDGKAQEVRYSILDGISSYFHGAASTLATENPWRAGLVGGIGSGISFVPNAINLSSLITKNGREGFVQQWKNASFGEKANMILSNGILNNYYAKKQGQLQLEAQVDLVNKMLNETNDFEAIDRVIALDMASIDATNPEDANALEFFKGVQAIDLLNRFMEDKEAVKVGQQSTIMKKAMTIIQMLQDPSKLTDAEKADFLSQYYAENPSTPQSNTQNEIALRELQDRAVKLQEASETYADIEDTLAKVEKERGTKIPNRVRARLVQRLTLDKFLTNRVSELEEKITGNRTPNSAETVIESYGTKEHQIAQVEATKNLVKSVEKEISKAEDALNSAESNLKKYEATPQIDQGFVKKTELQTAIDNARIQLEYLRTIKRDLNLQLDRFTEKEVIPGEGTTVITKTKTSDRVLTANEILRLNPQDRARMLDKANYNKYSDSQKAEIDKLRNELTLKDQKLLDDIQNQANHTQRVRANREAYTRMLENPEAAAYQFESDMARQALEASYVHMERQASVINDYLYKLFNEDKYKGITIEQVRDIVYKNLRVLNRSLLEYMRDNYNNSLGYIEKELNDAIDWTRMTDDISRVIDGLGLEDGPKNAFTSSLDRVLNNTRTTTDFLDELGRIIESPNVSEDAKVPYKKLLNELESIWNQRSSTTTFTREEREAAVEKATKKAAKEVSRIKATEESTRAEAERKKILEDEAKKEKAEHEAAILDAEGLTGSDLSKDNEAIVSKEEAVKAAEEGEEVDLGLINYAESPTLEEQAVQSEKVEIRPALVEDNTDQGNREVSSSEIILGNGMYGYELEPLKQQGIQVPRKSERSDDRMGKYFSWLDAAGIKLQDIIDTELGDIAKLNPKVYSLYTDMRPNATNDESVQDNMFLAVEYTPEVQSIHNDKLGGVITSNGKQYLIIGTVYAKGTDVFNQYKTQLLEDKIARKQFFDANPSERFFVNTNRHTAINTATITAGRLVRQLTTDSEVQIRTISELLSDEARNPKGLTIGDLKWGIQYDNRLATVNVSDRNVVYPPSDGASNLGSVFLLIEAANGNFIPAYVKPIRMSELRDGKLKTQINDLIDELTSTDHSRRLNAIRQLVQILHLTKEGSNILIGTIENPTVSIVKNNVVIRPFNLVDANFNRRALLEAIAELDPRVNITTSVLSDITQLEVYDEAGALTTDLAKLGTSGASYNVYAMDTNGNPIITTTVNSESPTLDVGSDLVKAERKRTKSVQFGKEVYREWDGQWHTATDKVVTDPRLIEQLHYTQIIRSRELKPDKVIGMDEIFILNKDKNNPTVIIRRRGNQIIPMTKENAIRTINDINAEQVEKARQERLQRKLEAEESNDNLIRSMSEEERQRAAEKGEDVDLGLNETLTDEQIVEQLMGNFEAEATPQQKTAEELVEQITSDAVDIHLSDDGATYVDINGKHYARVTSIISADEFSDSRLESSNPWVLPSTTIDTSINEFIRDFFDNKLGNMENLADRYPNATNEQFQAFAKQLEELKAKFKRRGLTIVPRDITVAGTVEIATRSGEKRVLDVAGTLDLLAYDRDGNFYIFDMKTSRGVPRGELGIKKSAKWSEQLSLYKQLLEEKYGIVVKGLEVIPIQVSYPAPKGWSTATAEYTKVNGQLYANKVEFRDAKPILHDNIPLSEATLSIDYSKLTPAEQAMVRLIEDKSLTEVKVNSSSSTTEGPVVIPDPIQTGEDINKTGTKSLAELQSDKTLDTALSIINSKKFGKRARTLLKSKFPDMPSKISEIERFLQSKRIATTGITDVEHWLKMIEECK